MMIRVITLIFVSAFLIFSSPFTISGLSQPHNTEQAVRLEKKEPPGMAVPAQQIPLPEPKAPPKTKVEPPTAAAKSIPQRDKQDLMEEALDLINESELYWKKGDIEIALDILDQAYSLVLSANGNADIARQKDDLRLLISRRILAIYSAKTFNVTNGKASQIPLVLNEDVEKEIRSFQTGERNFFIQSYRRSAIYLPIILRELKKAGLPLELAWLPLVESGYKINALSHARALGLWQFIPSTGYKFGLNRNEWIDERLDMEKSTLAAIAYLTELHGMFGDWLTALAAYNCGEGRLLRVISTQRINYFDRFWDLYHRLPYETARYVPRFIATLHIVNDPKKYGFDFGNEQSEQRIVYAYEKVLVKKSMRLQDIALHTNSSEETLNILNAELRHKVTPSTAYELKIPKDAVEKFLEVQESIPQWRINAKKVVRHRIKQGETFESIARVYNLSPQVIRVSNRTAAKKRLVAGQLIRVPINEEDTFTLVSSSSEPARPPEANSNKRKQIDDPPREIINYKVKPKDTLAALAKRFDLSVVNLKKMNNLRGDVLKTGQILVVAEATVEMKEIETPRPAKKKVEAGQGAQIKETRAGKSYTVKSGDNLNIIARKFETSVESLIKLNGITKKNNIEPGQRLTIN